QNILRNLDRKVTVYVAIARDEDGGDLLSGQVRTMLTNCQETTDKITSVDISRYDENKFMELEKRYGKRVEPGLLLEYDAGPGAKEKKFQQIRQDELASRDQSRAMNRNEPPPLEFKGEDALMSALDFLAEGKKSTIYISQGNGEGDLRE